MPKSRNYFRVKRVKLRMSCSVPIAGPHEAPFSGTLRRGIWSHKSGRSPSWHILDRSFRNKSGNGFGGGSIRRLRRRCEKNFLLSPRVAFGWPKRRRGPRACAAICKCTQIGAMARAIFARWPRRRSNEVTNISPSPIIPKAYRSRMESMK